MVEGNGRNQKLHRIVVDFREAEVAKKSEKPVWNGFRVWESVQYPIPWWTDFEKFRRVVNITGSPAFDPLSDWLMDFATIAAAGIGRTDWENFRRLVLIHVGKCTSRCWYCYNDAWDKEKAKCVFGERTAREIIEYFKLQQDRDAKRDGWECNVLRLSGGEPFLQPELVEDLAKEIANEKDIFFWVDTNLIPIARKMKEKEIDAALEALKKLKGRTAIHACFHGATDEKIKEITGTDISVEELLVAYQTLKEKNIPLYPRLNPCVCTPDEAERFFLKLYKVDKVAPAKLYLGPVELYYTGTRDRMIEVNEDPRRVRAHLHAAPATIFWWNEMMRLAYGVGYGVVPRHLCDHLINRAYANTPSELVSKLESEKEKRPNYEFVFSSKGFSRENYALKVLEALALPSGAHMTMELEGKYVEPNLFRFAEFFKDTLKGKDVLIVATHYKDRGRYHLTALRWAKLLDFRVNPAAVHLEVEVLDYPNECWNAKNGKDNYDFLTSYCGQKNLPIDGYYCQLMSLPKKYRFFENKQSSKSNGPKKKDEVEGEKTAASAFLRAVGCLNELDYEKVNKNIYYRIVSVVAGVADKLNDIKFEEGQLHFSPGELVEIEIDTFTKNLGKSGFPKEETAVLQVFTTEEDKAKVVSQNMIRLSKFGRSLVRLKMASTLEVFRGEIVFRPMDIEPVKMESRIVEVRLPFVVKTREI